MLSLPSPSPSSSSVSSSPNPLSKYNSLTKFASATTFDTGTVTGSKYLACFALNSFASATATTSSRASFGGLNEHPGCSGATAFAFVVGAVSFLANLFTPLARGALLAHISNTPSAFFPFEPAPFTTGFAFPLTRTASSARLGGGLHIFPARSFTGVGYARAAGAFSHAASIFSARCRARSRFVPALSRPRAPFESPPPPPARRLLPSRSSASAETTSAMTASTPSPIFSPISLACTRSMSPTVTSPPSPSAVSRNRPRLARSPRHSPAIPASTEPPWPLSRANSMI
mmetsp:Transcript_8151/g.32571  ORF Transcript_8151/g.32571 Transcript_8151/m.32571 type:complete len:287 (+) Transcript_8151:593-1453(+)